MSFFDEAPVKRRSGFDLADGCAMLEAAERGQDVAHLLVIEDDAEVRRLIEAYGMAMGWEVTTAADGASGLSALQDGTIDVVVLDVLLPDQTGWDVLRSIREHSDVYVIMLTALGTEADRIEGLTRGADDYVVKPFSPGELLARCRALLRRPRTEAARAGGTAPAVGLSINAERFEVLQDGRAIALTALEFRLLATLAGHPGRVFTREQLVADAFGGEYEGYDRVIDVHIGQIRKKLGDNAGAPRYIETVRGIGYRFRADPSR